MSVTINSVYFIFNRTYVLLKSGDNDDTLTILRSETLLSSLPGE